MGRPPEREVVRAAASRHVVGGGDGEDEGSSASPQGLASATLSLPMVERDSEPITVGNYHLHEVLGRGGMGTVCLGRRFGSGGFRRLVAIKRLHPHLALDLDFVTALLDEARIASRIHHPNVVAPLDVVATEDEVFLVLEYVHGLSLAALARAAGGRLEPRIAARIVVDVLAGLQAAHEARGDDGELLGLVHRDVSPQNVLVGKDGCARLVDFGIAKAAGRGQTTAEGVVKGKRGYMAPEQLYGASCVASDIYASGVVLWELLEGRRLFPDESQLASRMSGEALAWSTPGVDEALRCAVLRALDPAASARFQSAREMAVALERATDLASSREVGEWVERVGRDELAELASRVARVESLVQEGHLSTPPSTGEPSQAQGRVTESAFGVARESPVGAPTGAPRKRLRLAVGIAVLAVAFGAIAVAGSGLGPPSRAAAEPPQAKPPGGAATTAETLSPPGTDGLTSREVQAPSADPGRVEAPVRALATKRKPATARPSPRCKPYVIDQDGHKRFNEKCLR
jgi:eukaryotic-like serine/threonine-protein kinase